MCFTKIIKEEGAGPPTQWRSWFLSLCKPQEWIWNTKRRRRREGGRRKKIKGREERRKRVWGVEERKERWTERQGKQTASTDYKAEGCEMSTPEHVVFGAMAHDCTPWLRRHRQKDKFQTSMGYIARLGFNLKKKLGMVACLSTKDTKNNKMLRDKLYKSTRPVLWELQS